MHSEEFTVHVANLNGQSTQSSILLYFSYFGSILQVKMFYDRKGGRFNRGYCRLVISQKQTYNKILGTPHYLDGHYLNCTPYVKGQTQHYSDPENNQKKVIFNGVPSTLAKNFLKFCRQFGTVISSTHMTWVSNEPQTYLVVFAQVSDSEQVLKRKTFHFMGCLVTAEAFIQQSYSTPTSLAQSKVVHPTSSRILLENPSDSTTKHGNDRPICRSLQNGIDSNRISYGGAPNRDVSRESEPFPSDSGGEYQEWISKEVPGCNSSLPNYPNPSLIKAGREAQGREGLKKAEDQSKVLSMGVSWRDRAIVSKPKPSMSAHFKYQPLAGLDLRNREENYKFTLEPPY